MKRTEDRLMTDKHNKPYYQVSTLDKGLDVLNLLADTIPPAVSEAAKMLGVNRAGVFRFPATLQQWGYGRQASDGRTLLRSLRRF